MCIHIKKWSYLNGMECNAVIILEMGCTQTDSQTDRQNIDSTFIPGGRSKSSASLTSCKPPNRREICDAWIQLLTSRFAFFFLLFFLLISFANASPARHYHDPPPPKAASNFISKLWGIQHFNAPFLFVPTLRWLSADQTQPGVTGCLRTKRKKKVMMTKRRRKIQPRRAGLRVCRVCRVLFILC